MVKIPLEKKLKKKRHRTIAEVQDLLIAEVFDFFPKAVLIGGTVIWRCYGSNRFSEDTDFYFPKSLENESFEDFLKSLKKKRFETEKFKRTNNAIFAKFRFKGVIVRFEVVFKELENTITKPFEMADGSSIFVNTLPPERLIKEKVSAYLERKKVRDLYDIFYLLRFVEKEKVKKPLTGLLNEFEEPKDKEQLKALVVVGSAPSLKEMLRVIRKWAK